MGLGFTDIIVETEIFGIQGSKPEDPFVVGWVRCWALGCVSDASGLEYWSFSWFWEEFGQIVPGGKTGAESLLSHGPWVMC